MAERQFARVREGTRSTHARIRHTHNQHNTNTRARARARTHARTLRVAHTCAATACTKCQRKCKCSHGRSECVQTLRARMRNRSQPHPRRISSVGLMYDPGQLTLLQSNRHSSCTRSSSSRRRRRMSSGCSFSSLGRCAIGAVTRQVGGGQGRGRIKKGGGRRRRGREEERFEGGTFLEGNLLP